MIIDENSFSFSFDFVSIRLFRWVIPSSNIYTNQKTKIFTQFVFPNNATSQGLAQAISIDDKENKCISFDSEVFYKHTRKIYTNESENFRERGRKNTLVNGYEHDIYCLIDRYDTFDFGVSVSSSAKE